MINILVVTQPKPTGLTYHRQTVPHVHLIKNYSEFNVDYTFDISKATKEDLSKYQIVCFLRLVNDGNDVIKIINKCKGAGCKVVVDIDDFWYLDRFHHLNKTYKKYDIPQQTVIGLRNADLITTTTSYFADRISEINSSVEVLANSIDPSEPQFKVEPISSKRIRMGWIGGVYHYGDVRMMKEDFKYIWENVDNKNFQFCLGGYNPNKDYIDIEKIFTNNYSNLDDNYKDYLSKQKQSFNDKISEIEPYKRLWGKDVFNYAKLYNEIDIALIPLQENIFNGFKSQLKIIEAGWFGKPIIVSNVYPYKLDCTNENSYLIDNNNPLEWGKTIERVLNNKEEREEKAQALNELIKEKYVIDVVNKKRSEIYKRLCE